MVLRRLKGGLRRLIGADKTRGKMYARLCALGIRAQLAERGRPEEKFAGAHGYLGLIDIAEGPIRWVNVRNVSGTIGASHDQTAYVHYMIEYGVADSRDLPEVNVRRV